MLTAQGMEYTLDINVWSKFVRDMDESAKKLEVSLEIIEREYPVKDAVERQTEQLNDLKEKLYGDKLDEVLRRGDLTDQEKEVIKRALLRQFAGKTDELSRLASIAADPEIKAFIQKMAEAAKENEIQRQEDLGLKQPELVTA
jgi:hypothetical protein